MDREQIHQKARNEDHKHKQPLKSERINKETHQKLTVNNEIKMAPPQKGTNFLRTDMHTSQNSGPKNFLSKTKPQPTNFLSKTHGNQLKDELQPMRKEASKKDLSSPGQTLMQQYNKHVQAMIGVMRSDMRNHQTMEEGKIEFEVGFKKMLKNLDEKIQEINKIKKDIQQYKQALEEQDDDSRRSISGDDPFM